MQKIFLFVTCKETHSFLKLSAHFGYCTTSRAITIMYKNLLTIDAPKNSDVSFVWNKMCFVKGKSTRAGRAESLDSIPLGVQVYCNPFAAFTTHDSIPVICEHRAYMTIHKFQSFLPPHSLPRKGGGWGPTA